LDKLEVFVSKNGRAFYKKDIDTRSSTTVRLRRGQTLVTERYSLKEQDIVIVPFWSGKDLAWEIDN